MSYFRTLIPYNRLGTYLCISEGVPLHTHVILKFTHTTLLFLHFDHPEFFFCCTFDPRQSFQLTVWVLNGVKLWSIFAQDL